MDYTLKSRTKTENYHTIKLTKLEWSKLQLLFETIIQRRNPDVHLQDRDKVPTYLKLANYYYDVTFEIEHD